MPCYSPLHGYKNRHSTASGKRQITFTRSAGFSDLLMTVPCGQCIGCRIDRSRQWALRCVHEAKSHATSCFVTLTYDDDHLPEGQTLVKEDLQKFFKRLRKNYGKFRYFACGEYGEASNRPHYHAVLFGIDFAHDRRKHSTNKRGDTLFISKTLSEAWGAGHCLIGEFNYATAAYTARYIMKKQIGKHGFLSEIYERGVNLTTGEIVQVQPEFAMMSLKPGLGHEWYEKFKKDAFPSDFLIHDGKKHPVPRYYSNKLKKEDEESHKELSYKRKAARKKDASNNTPERLAVREEVKSSQLSQLSRSI